MAKDTRNFANGCEIPTEGYCDQPYIVATDDGAWLCALTTGAGHEGQPGQHVVSMRSEDMGRTWSAPVDVEPAGGPEASWSVLLKTPFGRVYCFYVYNTLNLRECIGENPPHKDGKCRRVDTLGDFVFKYSDDHGRTWSAARHAIPVREFETDRLNPYGGRIRYFWNVGKPFVRGASAFVPLHKVRAFGEGFMTHSEGAFVASDNLLTERDPEKIAWETLPDGDIGLRAPAGGGNIAEEQSTVLLSDGSLYCVYRTVSGHPACAYSRDGGRHWSAPAYASYAPSTNSGQAGGRLFKHPRAANFVWKCANGKYLYWFHNNGEKTYNHGLSAGSRNIAWLSGGVENDGFIHWSQPEIALYVDDQLSGPSYPDLIEANGRYYISATQKTEARVCEVDARLVEGLWRQFEPGCPIDGFAREGLLLDLPEAQLGRGASVAAPALPPLTGAFKGKDMPRDGRGGFSFDFWIRFDDLRGGRTILDARDTNGKGYALTTTPQGAIRFEMCDGWSGAFWDCDRGALRTGAEQHVAVIIDGGPKVILFVIDGALCDGGAARSLGFGRFNPTVKDVNGAGALRIAPDLRGRLRHLRIYGRALRVSEAIGNCRSELAATS